MDHILCLECKSPHLRSFTVSFLIYTLIKINIPARRHCRFHEEVPLENMKIHAPCDVSVSCEEAKKPFGEFLFYSVCFVLLEGAS